MSNWNILNIHMAACPECKEWAAPRSNHISRWGRNNAWPVGCVRFWQLCNAACKDEDNDKKDPIKA